MGDITTILPSYFGISTRATKERGAFICKTGSGITRISKSQDNYATIRMRHSLLDKLESSGFPFIDKIIPSTFGTPYVQLGRETFVMTNYIKGQELDLDCENSIALAVEAIAKCHTVANGFNDGAIKISSPLTEVFSKNITFLEKTLRQLNKTSRLSDFDVMFLKNVDKYTNDAKKSLELLNTTDYISLYQNAVHGGTLCHNSLKEENLQIFEEKCYITNWDDSAIDLQIIDFAGFLHRYARRSIHKISLFTILNMYDSFLHLPTNATKIIYAYLVHPWQFIKIAMHYYSKKRGWTPGAITSRMAKLLEEQAAYDEFISVYTL